MYENCCTKCGSALLHTAQKGNNTGLYCDDCGAWVKWLGKDELRAFEYSKKENLSKNSKTGCDYCNTKRIESMIGYQYMNFCPMCGESIKR